MYPRVYAEKHPNKAAAVLHETGEVLTYRRLEDRSTQLARHLRDLGMGRGDHLAMLTGNELDVFVIYWAALRSGLYVTAVNSHLTAREAALIVEDCGAQALIVTASVSELAADVAARVPDVGVLLSFGGPVPGFQSCEKVLETVSTEPLTDQPCGADMLYSSGTTGSPRGIKPRLPGRQVSEAGDPNIALFTHLYGMSEETVFLSPAPLYHAAPLRYCATVQALGGTAVIMASFDAERALAAIERRRVTHSQWVPTMFIRMLRLPDSVRTAYDVSSLEVAIHAAAPCSPPVKRAMIDWWGPIIVEYYSATEANGATAITSQEWLRKPGSVGRDGIAGTVHICDEAGRELGPGETGQIYFETAGPLFEYHGDPEKTAASRHPEQPNWTTTGDVGHLDEDRYLFLTDRGAHLIISGGVNIYPQEVENVLVAHPLVHDAAVVGRPHPDLGEVVHALVQPVVGPGDSDDEELKRVLMGHLSGQVATFKLPRSIELVEDLPRTATGKLLKRKLGR